MARERQERAAAMPAEPAPAAPVKASESVPDGELIRERMESERQERAAAQPAQPAPAATVKASESVPEGQLLRERMEQVRKDLEAAQPASVTPEKVSDSIPAGELMRERKERERQAGSSSVEVNVNPMADTPATQPAQTGDRSPITYTVNATLESSEPTSATPGQVILPKSSGPTTTNPVGFTTPLNPLPSNPYESSIVIPRPTPSANLKSPEANAQDEIIGDDRSIT